MSRRLEKLIEQKAWETLTDYGYNDAHLLEQLTESVLDRLYEETPKERRAREFEAKRKELERRRAEQQKKLAREKAAREARKARKAARKAASDGLGSGTGPDSGAAGSAGRGAGVSEAFEAGYRTGLTERRGNKDPFPLDPYTPEFDPTPSNPIPFEIPPQFPDPTPFPLPTLPSSFPTDEFEEEAEGIEMGGDPRRPVGGRDFGPGLTDPQKLIDRDLRRIREIEKELRDREARKMARRSPINFRNR